jgi:uncharacterized membrane protein YecN with MAPEG domain
MTTAIVCTGFLGLLVFGLGFAVSITRGRTGANFGYTQDPTDRLYKMVRAHGNTVEYAPMLAVLMLFLGTRGPANWVLWVMVIATACRYIQALGLIAAPTLARPHPLRIVGSAGTYLTGLLLCVLAFMAA